MTHQTHKLPTTSLYRNTSTNTSAHSIPPTAPSQSQKTIQSELSGFYGPRHAVYIGKATGLFRYNFSSPPRALQKASTRRGVGPQRVGYVKGYGLYLGCRERAKKWGVRWECERDVGEYIGMLKERRRVRRVEEAEDARRAEELCREFGLSMDGEEGESDGGGNDGIDSYGTVTGSSRDGIYGDGDTDNGTQDDSNEEEEEQEEEQEEYPYTNDIWESEANQSYLTRIKSIFRR